MKKVLFLLFFISMITQVRAQSKSSNFLKDVNLSLNGSVIPSESITYLGGSGYLTYKKAIIGFTYVEGETDSRVEGGNLVTITRLNSNLNLGSIGYEVTKDLFLKAGFGVYYVGGSVSVVNIGISSNTERFNDYIETPSFGVLYMNRQYHFNFGLDLIGASDPLMLFSLGFNI